MREGRVNWGLTIVVAIISLIVLVPLYFAVAMALKSPAQTGTGTGFNFPWPIHWGNFRAAWDLTNTPLAFSMSLLITVIAVTGEILVSSLAAWSIVRNWGHWQFRATFAYLMLALFIPFPVVALPQVKLMAAIGLSNPFGVAILHIMFQLAFNVLLFSASSGAFPPSWRKARGSTAAPPGRSTASSCCRCWLRSPPPSASSPSCSPGTTS